MQVARKEVAVEQLDARSPSLESSPAGGPMREGTRSETILRRGGKARKQQASNASVPNQEHPEAAHVKEKAQNGCAVRPTAVYSCRESVVKPAMDRHHCQRVGVFKACSRECYLQIAHGEQFYPISGLQW